MGVEVWDSGFWDLGFGGWVMSFGVWGLELGGLWFEV